MGSSHRWLQRQRRDKYVAQSREAGYRSRAAYKLAEIDESERLLRPGMTVVDLGAAPGGFSQYAALKVGETGSVVALDLLPMDPIPGVTFVQGDFTADETVARLEANLKEGVDLVMSDMAPNISGNKAVNQPRSMYLAELALDLARRILNPDGVLLVKLFQGDGFEAFVATARASFIKVKLKKPPASRRASREMYLLARTRRM